MNKKLFWTGLTAQAIHLGGILLISLMAVDWSLIDYKVFLGVGYVIFNIATLLMIFIGVLTKDEE